MTNISEVVEKLSASETLQKQLIEVVNSAINAGKNVADFAVEQTPLLVGEIITYNMVVSGIWTAVGLMSFVAIKVLFKKTEGLWEDDTENACFVRVFGSLILLVAGFICQDLNTLIKTIFAPRLFLIEYAANLVK